MSASGSGAGSRVARPLADFVRDVGLAVAEGQQELDRHSLATQLDIDRDAESGTIPHVFEAPWYRFAEVDVDMKLHVDTELETRRGRDNSTFYHPRLTVRPAEPGREDGGDRVDVTSSVHFRIIPAPPNLPPKQGADDEPDDDEPSDGGR